MDLLRLLINSHTWPLIYQCVLMSQAWESIWAFDLAPKKITLKNVGHYVNSQWVLPYLTLQTCVLLYLFNHVNASVSFFMPVYHFLWQVLKRTHVGRWQKVHVKTLDHSLYLSSTLTLDKIIPLLTCKPPLVDQQCICKFKFKSGLCCANYYCVNTSSNTFTSAAKNWRKKWNWETSAKGKLCKIYFDRLQ